jgi:phosphatidate cytidylyltransferase
MSEPLRQLFVPTGALDDSFVRWTAGAIGLLIVVALALNALLRRGGVISIERAADAQRRTLAWLVIAPVVAVPILLGRGWTMLAVCLLSLACWREFARATGVFRERLVSVAVVIVVLCVLFANLDHWPRLFFAAGPLGFVLVAMMALAGDRPRGYLQRTALGIFGVAFCAVGFGYLGLLANDPASRSILILMLLVTQLSDVCAYVTGSTLGRRALCPNTSPRKTLEGALGALVGSTAIMLLLGPFVFTEPPLADWRTLAAIGLLLGALSQLGDLMLSAVKRDIGIKDLGTLIPGHGGLLDRFDSLVLATPAYYHLISFFRGVATEVPVGLFSGGSASL